MSLRKFLSEFGHHMYGSYNLLLQQDQLENIDEVGADPNHPFNIYMVARRPRVTIDPESIQVTEEYITGRFFLQRRNTFEPHDFRIKNLLGVSQFRFESPYPHTEFSVYDDSGRRLSAGKVALLIAFASPEFWELLDLEVLYIGQAFGSGGERTAQDRLQSHSTLQAIYSEAIRRSPDQEIWLVLWCFDPLLIMSFDGTQENYGATDEEDDQHIEQVLRNRITRQQEINLTEAALIRYFQPEYNTIFKNSVPNPAHKTYSECYDLDLNSISVELDTGELRCRLWSSTVEPQWVHIMTYPLHSAEERQSMFDSPLPAGDRDTNRP
mgnify:CR=1 FL=1